MLGEIPERAKLGSKCEGEATPLGEEKIGKGWCRRIGGGERNWE